MGVNQGRLRSCSIAVALQAADIVRLGQSFVDPGGAGARAANHDDRPLRRLARECSARTMHTTLNAPRVVGKCFAYLDQEFTQLTLLSDNMSNIGGLDKQDSCQIIKPANIDFHYPVSR
jgi:hypothetical protein